MTDYEELFFRKSGYTRDMPLEGRGYFRFNTPWGFVILEPREKAMVAVAMCGDGSKLVPLTEQYVRDLGYTKIMFETKRPKGFERKYGYKPVAIVMEKEI